MLRALRLTPHAVALATLGACAEPASLRGAEPCRGCTVLRGGLLFDGERMRPGSLAVRDGEIASVAWDGELDGEGVDLDGASVLPGLVDLHTHMTMAGGPFAYVPLTSPAEDAIRGQLRSGVTTVLDLGGDRAEALEVRDRIREGRTLGPGVLAVGPFHTGYGGHPCGEGNPVGDRCVVLESTGDAAEAWAALAPAAPDALKVVAGDLPVDVLAALQAEADAAGVLLAAHVIRAEEVERGLDAGLRLFAHVPSTERISPDLAGRMAAEGAVLVPTLMAFEGIWRVATGQVPGLDDGSLEADVSPAVIQALTDPELLGSMTSEEYVALAETARDDTRANLATCVAAGVTVAAGTDAGVPGAFHGLALRDELALYVDAGMTPAEALRAATSAAADALGRPDIGRLEPGARADLLVVRGDPTAGVGALAAVEAVWLAGAPLDRDALDLREAASLDLQGPIERSTGETCLAQDECGEGEVCTPYTSLCEPTCEWDEWPPTCPEGAACYVHPEGGGYCQPGDGCDPIAQDCENGAACIWVGNASTVCNVAGEAVAGEPCEAGYSCAVGYQCDFFTDVCALICDPGAADPGCPGGQVCDSQERLAGVEVGHCAEG